MRKSTLLVVLALGIIALHGDEPRQPQPESVGAPASQTSNTVGQASFKVNVTTNRVDTEVRQRVLPELGPPIKSSRFENFTFTILRF